MSKGSKQRPVFVGRDTFYKNWNMIFQKPKDTKTDECKKDHCCCKNKV